MPYVCVVLDIDCDLHIAPLFAQSWERGHSVS
jgi:hypothetical protein